jgi:hypothetical protein
VNSDVCRAYENNYVKPIVRIYISWLYPAHFSMDSVSKGKEFYTMSSSEDSYVKYV